MARSRRVLVAVLLAVALFSAAASVTYRCCEARYDGAADARCDAGVYDLPDGLSSCVVYDARSNAEYVVVTSDDGDVAICPRIGEDGSNLLEPTWTRGASARA